MHSLCVFCGANPGRDPRHLAAARELGEHLARKGVTVVYGGASVGCMGALADAAMAAGGRVLGVIPRALWDKELAHVGITDCEVVESMHERKARMAELADGFVALPGGIGTLEEFFEVMTWSQLGFHHKPCGLLNVAGHYDGLLTFLDHLVAQGFLKPAHRALALAADSPAALLEAFTRFRHPRTGKWLDRPDQL